MDWYKISPKRLHGKIVLSERQYAGLLNLIILQIQFVVLLTFRLMLNTNIWSQGNHGLIVC